MKHIAINWKTSAAGLATLFATVAHIISTKTVDATDFTGIMTGIGLVFAKDGNVTGGTVQQ